MHLRMNTRIEQAIDKRTVLLIGKKLRNRSSDNLADILDIDKLLRLCVHQCFQRAKVRHQVICGLFTDIGNTDCKQEGIQLAVFALFQLGKQFVRLLFAKALERNQLFSIKAVQICG